MYKSFEMWFCTCMQFSGIILLSRLGNIYWLIYFNPNLGGFFRGPFRGRVGKFFWQCRISSVNFCYWSKFHVNIITGSRVLTIFLHIGLTRKKYPRLILLNIWRLGWLNLVRVDKFATNVSHEKLLNAAKRQGYSFYHSWVIKGEPTKGGGVVKLPLAHPG